jgi:cellulose synthase/poly-beta-1,6-N-acetylglucosamine synthase-like glycosyltransferase
VTKHYIFLKIALFIFFYAYAAYPLLLRLVALFKRAVTPPPPPAQWPLVSITVPVYNEAAVIRRKIESLLAHDYPPERRQILVVSDASTDGTDDVVREYAGRGVELLRLPRRGGKTAAENAALPHLRGEIIVNSDASTREPPAALRALIRWFQDPTVGVASGRDVSVVNVDDRANMGEMGYVNYEMWVRRLETRVAGIIGASGCFYAIRNELQQELVPEALSRDFAAPLIAREHGFRAVSVDDAPVFVPRALSIRREYHRKVRTMTRGLETLFYKRGLMNPFRYGWFAWELISHKLVRWLVPVASVLLLLSVSLHARHETWARVVAALFAVGAGLAGVGWLWPEGHRMPRVLALPVYFAAGNVASLHAWVKALRGDLNPTWEPTRRGVEPASP